MLKAEAEVAPGVVPLRRLGQASAPLCDRFLQAVVFAEKIGQRERHPGGVRLGLGQALQPADDLVAFPPRIEPLREREGGGFVVGIDLKRLLELSPRGRRVVATVPQSAKADAEVDVWGGFADGAKVRPEIGGLVPARLTLEQLGGFLEQAGVLAVHQQPAVAGVDGGLDQVFVLLHLPGQFQLALGVGGEPLMDGRESLGGFGFAAQRVERHAQFDETVRCEPGGFIKRGGAGGLQVFGAGLVVAVAALEVAKPIVRLGMFRVDREHLAVERPHLGEVGLGKRRRSALGQFIGTRLVGLGEGHGRADNRSAIHEHVRVEGRDAVDAEQLVAHRLGECFALWK